MFLKFGLKFAPNFGNVFAPAVLFFAPAILLMFSLIFGEKSKIGK